jgi:hypothetical protein
LNNKKKKCLEENKEKILKDNQKQFFQMILILPIDKDIAKRDEDQTEIND